MDEIRADTPVRSAKRALRLTRQSRIHPHGNTHGAASGGDALGGKHKNHVRSQRWKMVITRVGSLPPSSGFLYTVYFAGSACQFSMSVR